MDTLYKSSITSFLDNDFYKITMQHATVSLYADVQASYEFINRGKHEFPEGFGEELKKHVSQMAQLQLTHEEKKFLKETCPYLSPAYLDFLQGYRYDPTEVFIMQEGTQLSVAVKGYWYRTILWEVPLLYLISELFYKMHQLQRIADSAIINETINKTNIYNELGITVAEFGTRRRHSYEVHDLVMQTLKKYGGNSFVGSSNVHFAMKYQVKPIGTHAHEWFMFHAAKYGYKMANGISLEKWVQVYRGDLGIALSDTYTTEVFFRQFDKKFAKLFDGVRHDSGDPVEFAEKTINHYRQLGINPLYKTIIFSDGLNSEKVAKITHACKEKIGISFGIGTNLTNDVGLKAMNIVLKLVKVSGPDFPPTTTIKLSDEKGKHTGKEKDIILAKEMLGII